MNIAGITYLRELRLPGPKGEVIFRQLDEINLDKIYFGENCGATIIGFNSSESITQNPLFEINARAYRIARLDFARTVEQHKKELATKGVKPYNMVFLAHQTYTPELIAYSGRVAKCADSLGMGWLAIEVIHALRGTKVEFDPEYALLVPICAERLFRSQSQLLRNKIPFPDSFLDQIIGDTIRIPGNPNVDFEIYKADNYLFYHDMFMEKQR